ncbi:MAG TPA: hypothetical protein VMZ53_21090 [Kofleriaceae bacterium]|nr:hypothetical protein [Kofleriaceae bacterium]
MKKPRTVFAAPFVIVIACGHPADRPPLAPDKPDEPDEPERIARVPIDASAPVIVTDAACSAGEIACEGPGCEFTLLERTVDTTFTSHVARVDPQARELEIAIPNDLRAGRAVRHASQDAGPQRSRRVRRPSRSEWSAWTSTMASRS